MKRCNNCGWFNQNSVLSCEKCGEESFEIEEEAEAVVLNSDVDTTVPPIVDEFSSKEEEVPKDAPIDSLNKFAKSTVAINSAPVSIECAKKVDSVTSPNMSKLAKSTVAIDSVSAIEDSIKKEDSVTPSNIGKFAKATIAIDSDVPTARSIISSIFRPKSEAKPQEEVAANAPQPIKPIEIKCEKCCYPISGYVEYCPNCGASIRSTGVETPIAENLEEKEPVNNSGYAEPIANVSPNLKMTISESVDESASGLVDVNDVVYRLIPVDVLSEAVIELRVGQVVMIRGERFKFDL